MANIVIDPGHGGKDSGAVDEIGTKFDDEIYSDKLYTQESTLNLSIGLMLWLKLNQNHNALITRQTDEYLSLKKRCNIANSSCSDLFISIHANAFKDPDTEGTETFYFVGSNKGRELAKSVQQNITSLEKQKNRGAKANETFYVLKHTIMPSILIECGFITNVREEKLLNSPEYQYQLINQISKTVDYYDREYLR